MNDQTLLSGYNNWKQSGINNSIPFHNLQSEIKFETEFRYTNADSTLIMGTL